ncbi:MAG: ribonuclease P protein component [Saprospiraceae bacterium]|jgi:ribonuclease P protein component|nr:ribonuclease P protein component [Lewinellaceae bacterium]
MRTFSTNERLKSRKLIGRLFREGNSYIAYPLRVVWLPVQPDDPALATFGEARAQLAISVPRRTFKTAVQRNRLKRRIREAYRLNKQLFYEKLTAADQHIALMLVLVAKEEVPYATIEAGVQKMIRKFP